MTTSPITTVPGGGLDLVTSTTDVPPDGSSSLPTPLDPFPYGFIDMATARPARFVPVLLETLQADASAPARLVAAWALGAIGRRSALPTLRTSYAAELEPNVRANIAWAMLRCSSWRPSRRDIEVLLDDPYDAVVLIALKAVCMLPGLVRRDPLRLYATHSNVVVRATILEQLHRFAISSRRVKRFLEDTVTGESLPWLRASALRALSRADPARAARLSLELARSAQTPQERTFLRVAFVEAALSAGESRWCPELSAVYVELEDPVRRWDVIAATVAAGGPAGATALMEMETTETDDVTRAAVRRMRDALVITVAAEAARSMGMLHGPAAREPVTTTDHPSDE